MARGRIIEKEFSYDERVWGMSVMAALCFAACIAHTEGNGTLPRSASAVRLMCFPLAKITTHEAEGLILEWIAAKICSENGNRLFFVDFDKANSGLILNRARQQKYRQNENVTSCNVINARSEGKGSEGKGSEEKKKLRTTDNGLVRASRTIPPTTEQVAAYCLERKNGIDAAKFVDYYGRQGWLLKNGLKIKDWQSAVRTWERQSRKPVDNGYALADRIKAMQS